MLGKKPNHLEPGGSRSDDRPDLNLERRIALSKKLTHFGSAAMVVETAARVGAKPLFVVVNNEGIAGHMLQDHMLPPGSPKIASLLPARYEKLAEMVDGHSEYVEQPSEIRPALDRALAADKLAVVHVRVNPKAMRMGGTNYLQ